VDFLTSTPVLLLAVWLVVALLLRLAYVALRRERERERFQAESRGTRAVLTYGATDVRAGVGLGAVLVVALAVAVTWRAVDGPLDAEEMDELVREVAASYDAEDLDDAPQPTADQVRDRIREAGTDPDEVVVVAVASGWEDPDGIGYRGARFQLFNADGGEPRCLEITWINRDSGVGSSYEVSGGEAPSPEQSVSPYRSDALC
jgi:hypothetical protein